MQFKLINAKHFIILSFLLVTLYGCGGGGSSASVGSLFAGGLASNDPTGDDGDPTGGNLPKTHNPEPMSLLLMGSGAMAMTYLKKRKK